MIDFVKLELNVHETILLDNPLLDFQFSGDCSTGEVHDYPLTTKGRYRSFSFKITKDNSYANGTFHKYWQNGCNWRDFSFQQATNAIDCFCKSFGVDAENCILHNIEFGVNIVVPFKATLRNIANTFVCYKSKPFQTLENYQARAIGVECKLSQYRLKIYSKAIQYTLNEEILRIEIQIKKMQKLGGKTWRLSDLLRIDAYYCFKENLVRMMGDIIIYDGSLLPLTKKEYSFMQDVRNPNYWGNLSPNQFYRKKEKYKEMVDLKSKSRLKENLTELVTKKCDELIELGLVKR